ncbi:hypothetical protein [Ramlibacter tataouinensis]|uniref:Uncharacterized protein n=1 Tax=Ramlibacter tataouinensis (strain ATCC BAA-407 / DSM 14655 / LMG 21543 / TTB310) TaxID=365046 RepID=F5Y519_RAMTT|nr:hypothetical protein [Ramlibacter tataouinensis]AEG93859.1 Hypothetical protein Rta_27560 [Ramlibacter tataouinensis TTB310]
MLKTTTLAAALVSLAAAGLAGCDVQKTQEGNVTVPKYEVEKTQSGNVTLPGYKVTPPDVQVSTTEKSVTVPNVDVNVKKEEKKIEVPTVQVKPAPDR